MNEPRGCPTPGACSCVEEVARLRGETEAALVRLRARGGLTDTPAWQAYLADLTLVAQALAEMEARAERAERAQVALLDTEHNLLNMLEQADAKVARLQARGEGLAAAARARLVKLEAWLASEWRTPEPRTVRSEAEEERDTLRAALLTEPEARPAGAPQAEGREALAQLIFGAGYPAREGWSWAHLDFTSPMLKQIALAQADAVLALLGQNNSP